VFTAAGATALRIAHCWGGGVGFNAPHNGLQSSHQAPSGADAAGSGAAVDTEAVPSEAVGERTVGMGRRSPMPCAVANGDGRWSMCICAVLQRRRASESAAGG